MAIHLFEWFVEWFGRTAGRTADCCHGVSVTRAIRIYCIFLVKLINLSQPLKGLEACGGLAFFFPPPPLPAFTLVARSMHWAVTHPYPTRNREHRCARIYATAEISSSQMKRRRCATNHRLTGSQWKISQPSNATLIYSTYQHIHAQNTTTPLHWFCTFSGIFKNSLKTWINDWRQKTLPAVLCTGLIASGWQVPDLSHGCDNTRTRENRESSGTLKEERWKQMAVKTVERRKREGQLVQFHSRISGASAKPLAQITAFPV